MRLYLKFCYTNNILSFDALTIFCHLICNTLSHCKLQLQYTNKHGRILRQSCWYPKFRGRLQFSRHTYWYMILINWYQTDFSFSQENHHADGMANFVNAMRGLLLECKPGLQVLHLWSLQLYYLGCLCCKNSGMWSDNFLSSCKYIFLYISKHISAPRHI